MTNFHSSKCAFMLALASNWKLEHSILHQKKKIFDLLIKHAPYGITWHEILIVLLPMLDMQFNWHDWHKELTGFMYTPTNRYVRTNVVPVSQLWYTNWSWYEEFQKLIGWIWCHIGKVWVFIFLRLNIIMKLVFRFSHPILGEHASYPRYGPSNILPQPFHSIIHVTMITCTFIRISNIMHTYPHIQLIVAP